jgi:hypothetical protein
MIFQVDPFQRLYRADTGGCSIVQALDEKPLVVTVGSGEHVTCSRRVVKLYALNKQGNQEICKLPFETPVLGIRITTQRYNFFLFIVLTLKRLVVITESEIHIYNTENLNFLAKLSTSPNPKGNFSSCLVLTDERLVLLGYGRVKCSSSFHACLSLSKRASQR